MMVLCNLWSKLCFPEKTIIIWVHKKQRAACFCQRTRYELVFTSDQAVLKGDRIVMIPVQMNDSVGTTGPLLVPCQ